MVKSGRPGKNAVAEVVGSLKGTSAIAVARQVGGASAMATAKPSGATTGRKTGDRSLSLISRLAR